MSGDKSLTAVSNRVEKKDSNEPPEFEEGATAPRTVVENTPPGHPIGAPVTATDPDDRPSALSYALSGQDAAFFEIDASGQIMVGEDTVLDYETKREYRVTVTVTDPANATDSIIVTIEVLDVNEPPAFAVETATLPIPENTPAGQAIDDPLTATDEDTNDTLTYTLSGRDATFFAVDANGQLTVGGGTVLDHETQQTYSLTVTATDNAEPPATASIPVSITVTDAPGTVSLSPTPPQVGRELTASVDDPDPPVSVSTWRWERSEDKTTWSLIEGASTATYTPSSDDSRHYLRVTVAYTDTDGRGTAKQAEKITAQPVSARRRPPPPPGPGPGPGPGGGDDPVCADDRHGNTAAQATDIALATETAGAICPAADVDYVTVTVPERGLVFVDTTGSVPTRGPIWQNDEVLASGSTGGRGARLGARVQAGAVVVAVQGQGGATGTYAVEITFVQGYLENPGAESFQSGVGVLSGWVCEAAVVEIELNGMPQEAAYGTERLDTAGVCGDTDNGFGLLFNWNLLGDGAQTVVAVADGVAFDQATFTVTTLGEEFVTDAVGETVLADFPTPGEEVRLVWQQANQNFVLAPLDGEPPPASPPGSPDGPVGALENPGPASFQSGIGLLSGWVCEADVVELEINGGARIAAAYGTDRADTAPVCGDPDNGFGLLFNWNLLGDGVQTVVAVADGDEFGRATFTVTTLGVEFLEGGQGETVVVDFPSPGEEVRLIWQQANQNFVLAPLVRDTAETTGQ